MREISTPASFGVATQPVVLPSIAESAPEYFRLRQFFRTAAASVLRPPEGCLAHPFIVPGASYSTQLWDWDSYWFARGMLSLAVLDNDAELTRTIGEHGAGTVMNFLDHQAPDGGVPILMRADDPDVFGCLLRDGVERNQAKPVLAQFALMASNALGDCRWIDGYWGRLMAFLDRWRTFYTRPPGLLVWGSDLAVGVDNDPTVFGRPVFSSGSLLLNCLYIEDLRAAATLAARLGRTADRDRLEAEAGRIAALVAKHCWDPIDRFYYTADVQCRDDRAGLLPMIEPGMAMSWQTLPLKIKTFSGFWPLAIGIAGSAEAEALSEYADDHSTFRSSSGIRSLSRTEPMYSEVASSNPSNWLGPVWTITTFVAWLGLRRYGYMEQANALARSCCDLLERDLAESGALHEYYVPDTGEAVMNRGFQGWNALSLEMIATGLGPAGAM